MKQVLLNRQSPAAGQWSHTRKFAHFVQPMLAKLHDSPFDDADWFFEIKWDGYRAIAEINKTDTRIYSRNGLSFETAYPEVFAELSKIKSGVITDGEIVVLDAGGKPSFQLLQQYGQNEGQQICYYVFDCLHVNGKSIESKPLYERKKILKELLPESDVIRYCDHVEERGTDFFKAIKKQGLEGMIAKRADSRYAGGRRTDDWLKVKNIMMEEAVIAGYTQARGSRKHFGALILGVYEKGNLQYIGHTGTGFDNATLKELYEQLQPLKTSDSPFSADVPVNAPVTWVKPKLVCNLKYTEITGEGHRRHPVFMGLRIDKAAKDVHEEVRDDSAVRSDNKKKKSAMMETEIKAGTRKVQITHPDKVFFPDEGYTKGDVINYYNTVYPCIIRYMKDRPESLLRMPNGIKEAGFFHKDAGLTGPDWVKSIPLFSESADKEINYIICNDRATLLYMANLGCIEMNPWNSRLKHLDRPDYLVMDIDPSEKNTFEQVIETANVIKEILDKAGAPSFPKTSGATGIHVYVPLGAKYTYDQCKDFAHMIAMMTQSALPSFTSLERSLSKRGKDNIYIDFLQNRKGQTLSCAYSLRPKAGATVSTPLEWSEVKSGLHPSNFTMNNIMDRIQKKGDIFSGVLLKGIDMKKCISRLAE